MKLFRREKSIEMLEIINGVNVSDHVRKVRALARMSIWIVFLVLAAFFGTSAYFKYLNTEHPGPPECGSGQIMVYTKDESMDGFGQACMDFNRFLEEAGLNVQDPTA